MLVHPADLTVSASDRLVDVQLLADADCDLLTAHPGQSRGLDVDGVAELVDKQSYEATPALTGHPENRNRHHVAVRDCGPVLVERAAPAGLALQVPETTALSSTPRTAGAPRWCRASHGSWGRSR